MSFQSKIRKTFNRRESIHSLGGCIEKAKKLIPVHRPRDRCDKSKTSHQAPRASEQPKPSSFKTPIDLNKPVSSFDNWNRRYSSVTPKGSSNFDINYSNISDDNSIYIGGDETSNFSVNHIRPPSLACRDCSYYAGNDAFHCYICGLTLCCDCANEILAVERSDKEIDELEQKQDFQGIFCDCEKLVPPPLAPTRYNKPRKNVDYYEDVPIQFQMPTTPVRPATPESSRPMSGRDALREVFANHEIDMERSNEGTYPDNEEKMEFERRCQELFQLQKTLKEIERLERASKSSSKNMQLGDEGNDDDDFEDDFEGDSDYDDNDKTDTDPESDLGTETDVDSGVESATTIDSSSGTDYDDDDDDDDNNSSSDSDNSDANKQELRHPCPRPFPTCPPARLERANNNKICQECRQVCRPGFLYRDTPNIDPNLADLLRREGIKKWPRCLDVVKKLEGDANGPKCVCGNPKK